MSDDPGAWLTMGTLVAIPLAQTKEGYEAELRGFNCPPCADQGVPSTLTMRDYAHAQGELMEDQGRFTRRWVYGICETCQCQWSLVKLRRWAEE